MYLTCDSDIILIETKLIRNSESHRTVVAQTVDYAKALTKVDPQSLTDTLQKSPYSDINFRPNDHFISSLKQNLRTGNFKTVIAGDYIHPNVLEMVDSIQAAPHLSFTIFLVEFDPKEFNNESIILTPRVVSQTLEVERSVIRLEISHKGEVDIDSETPDKEGTGSKPKISSDEYIKQLGKPDFARIIQDFWKKWKNLGGDIRFGTVGFSVGMVVEGRRKALQFAYQERVSLLSDKWRKTLGISDSTYTTYKEYIKDNLPVIYDTYLVSNRMEIPYDTITPEDLQTILGGVFIVVEKEYQIK